MSDHLKNNVVFTLANGPDGVGEGATALCYDGFHPNWPLQTQDCCPALYASRQVSAEEDCSFTAC